MKYLARLFSVLLIMLAVGGTVASPDTPANPKKPVEIYYFHPAERCPIDLTIEENTRKVVTAEFARELKDGSLIFKVLNTDDKACTKIVSRFDINAQALWLVKTVNGKEERTDLTEFAFSFSQSNPARFKSRLKAELAGALK